MTQFDFTTSDIQKWLDRFSYKSGWEFELQTKVGDTEDSVIGLSVIMHVLDASGSDKVIPVQMVKKLIPSRYKTEDEFYEWLKRTIWIAEDHEMMEWFKVDGKKYDDPHLKDLEKLGELDT